MKQTLRKVYFPLRKGVIGLYHH